jgi:hypothetical protein
MDFALTFELDEPVDDPDLEPGWACYVSATQLSEDGTHLVNIPGTINGVVCIPKEGGAAPRTVQVLYPSNNKGYQLEMFNSPLPDLADPTEYRYKSANIADDEDQSQTDGKIAGALYFPMALMPADPPIKIVIDVRPNIEL